MSRTHELVTVDERAVGGLEVLDRCRAVRRRGDPGMLRGRFAVLEHEICFGAAANHDRPVQRDLLARVRPFDDLKVQFARHGAAAYKGPRSFRNI